jgi:hypothetical protein
MSMSNLPMETVEAERILTAPLRARRYEVELEVDLTLAEQHLHGSTRTLSLGGAFIESNLRPAFNSRVQLAIHVPFRDRPIDVSGVVRWSDGRGFGVQFDGLRAHDVWVLGKFFEQESLRPA